MSGSKLLDLNTTNYVDDVQGCGEGDPKQFVLRGNAECEHLLSTLARLGVTSFRCFGRSRNGDNAEVFAMMPDFKVGVRVSASGLEEVRRTTASISHLIWCAACESVAIVSAEDCDLLVEALVFIDDPRFPPRVSTSVTIINANSPAIRELEIQLL
jgi:hypothetical protein